MIRFVEKNRGLTVLAVCGVDLVLWAVLWFLIKELFVERPVIGTGLAMLSVAVFCMRLAYLRDHETS